ncbi:MAG: FeoB-associated Cys-rich membrane protein [Sedimentisphaerales bacterium]|nr:FeoB-associated Cys-rich membrane protein [Sedimentisphaerales bacterium]
MLETAIVIIIVLIVSFFVVRSYYRRLTSKNPACGDCKKSCRK